MLRRRSPSRDSRTGKRRRSCARSRRSHRRARMASPWHCRRPQPRSVSAPIASPSRPTSLWPARSCDREPCSRSVRSCGPSLRSRSSTAAPSRADRYTVSSSRIHCSGRTKRAIPREPPMEENRKKALAAALGQIEKQFGKGSVMRLGDATASFDVETVSTGSLGLDIALGIGGLPRGRVVEVFGPEASGKTTLTLQVIAEVQRSGGTAAFVDAEHALDPSYAEKLGVNINDLLVSQPDTGEQALEITDMLVRSNAVDIVVVDSVAALTPKAEIEGEMGEMQVGLHARLMSQALRKLT